MVFLINLTFDKHFPEVELLYDTGIYSKVTAGNVAVKHKKGCLSMEDD